MAPSEKTPSNDIIIKDEEWSDNESNAASDNDDLSDTGGFVQRPSLPDSNVVKRSLKDLMNLMDGPYLDLSPDYQRDVVWAAPRMSGLIDSLIENYFIPPIIFNAFEVVTEDGSRRLKRVCVDGKQRLSSVQAFMKGRIPCHDKNGSSWYYCDRIEDDGSTRRKRHSNILPEFVKIEFRRKEFICYEFFNLSSVQEEDLFARVQKGVELTLAEKLRATNGVWQAFTRSYEDEFRMVVNLSQNVRAQGFRHLLSCFIMIIETQNPSNADGTPVLKTQATHLQNFIHNKSAYTDSTKAHLHRVFSIFKCLTEIDEQTFKNNGYKSVKSFAPIEMIGVAVLLSMYGEIRNNNLLLGDIREMRLVLRQQLQDLRMNAATWKVVWKYIYELEVYRGAVDGSTALKDVSREITNRAVQSDNETVSESAQSRRIQRGPFWQSSATDNGNRSPVLPAAINETPKFTPRMVDQSQHSQPNRPSVSVQRRETSGNLEDGSSSQQVAPPNSSLRNRNRVDEQQNGYNGFASPIWFQQKNNLDAQQMAEDARRRSHPYTVQHAHHQSGTTTAKNDSNLNSNAVNINNINGQPYSTATPKHNNHGHPSQLNVNFERHPHHYNGPQRPPTPPSSHVAYLPPPSTATAVPNNTGCTFPGSSSYSSIPIPPPSSSATIPTARRTIATTTDQRKRPVPPTDPLTLVRDSRKRMK